MKKLTADDPETSSADVVADNIEQLKALFPESITEGQIDFEVLKQLLSGELDDKEEKYGLNWHGKRRARQLALTPSTGTLLPCPEDSVDWDTTQNLMIEGDNLEVLKLLQKSYAGRVKLIYIDPPYNTGKDFIYPDDFRDNIQNYLQLTGQIDGNGKKLSSNTEASGRFHTDWLNMMYPRLKLARNLLRKDGAIFVTIDDTEVDNLRKLLSEVFGEENFVATFVWQAKDTPGNDAKEVAMTHNYVVFFRRSDEFKTRLLPRTDDQIANYKNPDNDPRGVWLPVPLTRGEFREHDYYPIQNPAGEEVLPPPGNSWRRPKEALEKLATDGRLWWGKGGNAKFPFMKKFLTEMKKGVVATTWWDYKATGSTRRARAEIKGLFEGERGFDTPKPTDLVKKIMSLSCEPDTTDIVLDFFAGSGTTGHAVLDQNEVDSGNRRYILVQLPEYLDVENKDQQAAAVYCDRINRPRTISELTKERLRKAAKKIKEENSEIVGDLGFRVFKLNSSNIRAWEPETEDLERSLLDHVEHIKEARSEEDVLYELLLKLGLDLCVPIENRSIADKTVYSIGAGTLIACLDEGIQAATVEPLALGIADWHKELDPLGESTVVFRDSAFADDVAKTNLTAILQQHGLENVRSL